MCTFNTQDQCTAVDFAMQFKKLVKTKEKQKLCVVKVIPEGIRSIEL